MSIKLEKIEKSYKQVILNNIDLQIEDGEFVVIMGPSGTGKSTLLKILALQIRETSGRYILNNQDVSSFTDKERSKFIKNTIGYVDQEIYLFDSLTIRENVELAQRGANKEVNEDEIRLLLKHFKLSDVENKYPYELSSGQRQRVVIVRNLLKNPQILLMDEPTSSLDYATSIHFMNLIAEFQMKSKITTVVVTHNTSIAKYASRIILLKDGKVFTNVYRTEDDMETKINNSLSAMYRSQYDRI